MDIRRKDAPMNGPKTIERITAESLVQTVVEHHPQTVAVFVKHRLHCPGCSISPHHTLADCARQYAIALTPLLEDLNQVVASS
jgi:hybrid cluster-associated redox disulfide protein